MTTHDWLLTLRPGERYYKPDNVTWHGLKYWIEEDSRYRQQFRGRKLHQLRGDMFALACRHCGGIEQ